MTRVWLRSDVRDVTNPFTGSVRAHGEQRQRTMARRRGNTPTSNLTRAGSRERLGLSGTRSRARGGHGGAYQGVMQAGVRCRGVGDELRRRRSALRSWAGRCGGPLGSWVPRIGS